MWRLTLPPLAATALVTFALTLAACGGSERATGPGTGTLIVTTSTTGDDLDPAGYTVSLDGGQGIALGLNGTDTMRDVPAASHDVKLDGVQSNCSAPGRGGIGHFGLPLHIP